MSCFLLDIELADIKINKDLEVFIDGRVQGYSCRPPKKYKPTKQAFWCKRHLQGIVWNNGCLDFSEITNILPRDVTGGYFANGTEKCRRLAPLVDEEVENLINHSCPKAQDLVDEEN